VANDGWKLLPYYRFSIDTGLWRHRDKPSSSELGFEDLSFASGKLAYRSRRLTAPETALEGYLAAARRIVSEAEKVFMDEGETVELTEKLERLRWFPLPTAAVKGSTPDS
jgi:hypothetical protein